MPLFNPSRAGQADAIGDPVALFLKVFAGEVLVAFEQNNRFLSRTMVRSIASGKSAQFPASGRGTASYHTPGNELLGAVTKFNERVISIDDLLVADRFVSEIDEAMTHYDFRAILSFESGESIARTLDQHLAQVGYLAARGSATVAGENGGTSIDITASAEPTADELVSGVFTGHQNLDEKNVPEDGRSIFWKPREYYKVLNQTTDKAVINRDFTAGENGGLDSGLIVRIGGAEVVKTNSLPDTKNIASGPAAYQGDFTNSRGLMLHSSAVGTVKLIDVAVEMDYLIERQGTLLVSKTALGHGILRPESAVEFKTA